MDDLIAERLKDADTLLKMRHECGNAADCAQCRNVIAARLLNWYRRGIETERARARDEQEARD